MDYVFEWGDNLEDGIKLGDAVITTADGSTSKTYRYPVTSTLNGSYQSFSATAGTGNTANVSQHVEQGYFVFTVYENSSSNVLLASFTLTQSGSNDTLTVAISQSAGIQHTITVSGTSFTSDGNWSAPDALAHSPSITSNVPGTWSWTGNNDKFPMSSVSIDSTTSQNTYLRWTSNPSFNGTWIDLKHSSSMGDITVRINIRAREDKITIRNNGGTITDCILTDQGVTPTGPACAFRLEGGGSETVVTDKSIGNSADQVFHPAQYDYNDNAPFSLWAMSADSSRFTKLTDFSANSITTVTVSVYDPG